MREITEVPMCKRKILPKKSNIMTTIIWVLSCDGRSSDPIAKAVHGGETPFTTLPTHLSALCQRECGLNRRERLSTSVSQHVPFSQCLTLGISL